MCEPRGCRSAFWNSSRRNAHTRRADNRTVAEFMTWCVDNGVTSITAVQPLHVSAWHLGGAKGAVWTGFLEALSFKNEFPGHAGAGHGHLSRRAARIPRLIAARQVWMLTRFPTGFRTELPILRGAASISCKPVCH
jgi:hypothetical protein